MSLAEQKIEECVVEESVNMKSESNQDKIERFHRMVERFYNPETNISDLLPIDVKNVADP